MSAYADTLPPGQRSVYEQAVAAAGRELAAMRRRRDALAAAGGARAVAEAAAGPGDSPGEIERIYERLQRGQAGAA